MPPSSSVRGSSSTSVPAKVASNALTTTPKPLAAPIRAIAETTSRPARRVRGERIVEHVRVIDPDDRADQGGRDGDVERPTRPPRPDPCRTAVAARRTGRCRSRTGWSPLRRRPRRPAAPRRTCRAHPSPVPGTSATTTPARPPRTRARACSPTTIQYCDPTISDRAAHEGLGDQHGDRGDRTGCGDRRVRRPRPVRRARRQAAWAPSPRCGACAGARPIPRARRFRSTARRAATAHRCPRPPRRPAPWWPR